MDKMKESRRRQKRYVSFFLVLIMAMGVMSCKIFKSVAIAGDSFLNASNIKHHGTLENINNTTYKSSR